jgi:hypothetical protein
MKLVIRKIQPGTLELSNKRTPRGSVNSQIIVAKIYEERTLWSRTSSRDIFPVKLCLSS